MMDQTSQRIDAGKLPGTWLLVALEAHADDGDLWLPYGPNPVGQIMYDPAGYMSVVFVRSGRPKLAENDYLAGSADELKAAFQGLEAYAGKYTLDADAPAVIHHPRAARLPNWEGADQIRYIQKLTDDELQLGSPPILAGGKQWRLELRWVRGR